MPTPKKAYCFTLNNYSDEELRHVIRTCETESRYAIFGEEVGEHGTPHLQGYIIFKRAYRFDTIKNRYLPRCHIEVSAGSVDANRRYCSKDGKYREFGTKPSSGSSRAECAGKFVQAMGSGRSGLDSFIDEEPAAWYFSGHNLLRNYVSSRPAKYRGDVSVCWYYGRPGCGKSRRAHEELPEAYIKEPRTKWWNGYLFETDVIIDDFGPNGIDINHLLRWFDRYKCYVENKGGMQALYATKFVVTSNFHPDDCFKNVDGSSHPQMEALLRRVSVILMN